MARKHSTPPAPTPSREFEPLVPDHLTARWLEFAIRLGVLAVLLYWSVVLVQPFASIAIWSVVLTVALYPLYERMVKWLGGRRRLAAGMLVLLTLLVVIGPATWLVVSLIESVRTVSERFDLSSLALPPPPLRVKDWPLVGDVLYQFWDLASTNIRAAFTKIAPQLKPLGSTLLQIAAGAGTGTIKFLAAIVVAGFLFSPGPSLANSVRTFASRLDPRRGADLVDLAGATIRAVSRGVIGISALQAFFAGLGLMITGIPGASIITSAVLILGIIQIGPSIILIPLIVWSWFSMDMTSALVFTSYMVPVCVLDNVLRPLVMARGLDTPMLVILIGVIGGTISHGLTGLFLGPIILAVIWKLLAAWIGDREAA